LITHANIKAYLPVSLKRQKQYLLSVAYSNRVQFLRVMGSSFLVFCLWQQLPATNKKAATQMTFDDKKVIQRGTVSCKQPKPQLTVVLPLTT